MGLNRCFECLFTVIFAYKCIYMTEMNRTNACAFAYIVITATLHSHVNLDYTEL